jgi:hypothetical protein
MNCKVLTVFFTVTHFSETLRSVKFLCRKKNYNRVAVRNTCLLLHERSGGLFQNFSVVTGLELAVKTPRFMLIEFKSPTLNSE